MIPPKKNWSSSRSLCYVCYNLLLKIFISLIIHAGADDQDARKFPLQSDNQVLSPTSKCLQDRQQALQNAKSKQLIMLGVFVAKCESDGSYSQVQCLDSSQYCWCVDKMGKEIHRTRVRGSRPRCPTLNLAHSRFNLLSHYGHTLNMNTEGAIERVRFNIINGVSMFKQVEFRETVRAFLIISPGTKKTVRLNNEVSILSGCLWNRV